MSAIERKYQVSQIIDRWLAEQIEYAVKHHAATNGNGHDPDDHCESWYALQHALTAMHAGTWNLAGQITGGAS